MATQYRCVDDEGRLENRRRDAVRHPSGPPVVNGIDHLEVAPDQRTLRVYFVHALPGQPDPVPPVPAPALTAAQVVIAGGVRVQGIRVETVTAAGNQLTVTVSGPGDFSTYRLSLVSSAAGTDPPPGFDPQLSSVDFSFKVDCPSDFDCRRVRPCPEPTLPAPPLDYLAKDYASFRRLVLDRLAVVMPAWTDRNPADVEVALVELLAYAGDHLSYTQDAVATEAYLGTARLRASLRRHARLVDYRVHDGANARAWVCFEVSADVPGTDGDPALPASSMLLTRGPDDRPTVAPGELAAALAERPLVFETLHGLARLTVARNAVSFYTWGDRGCCLPAGATRATLDGSAADLGLAAGDVLVLEEVLGAGSGLEVDADPGHRHAVRLRSDPVEREDPLFPGRPLLDVAWYDDDALPFPLCLRQFPDSSGATRGAAVARANVVLADHGRSVAGEPLSPATVPDGERYRPALRQPGLTQQVPYSSGQARGEPAVGVTAPDVRQALPALAVHGGGEVWRPRPDLLASDRFATELVVETEPGGEAQVRFGDGVLGRRPPAGTELRATYRIGNGRAGDVGAEAIGRLVTSIEGIERVRNPLPATGGTDPEPAERVRLSAPAAFRTQERAVTEEDWAAVAQRHPEVQRAAGTRRWTGSWYTMFVTVDRRGGRPVDSRFESDLRGYLERFRMAGWDLEVDAPRFVALDVALLVCVAPGYLRSNVAQALLAVLGTADLPTGGRGLFHPDDLTFGQPVYLSKLVATAMDVPGVQWVDTVRFRRFGQPARGEREEGRISLRRLEIARLDNDPTRPENGTLELVLEGGR